MSSITIAHKRDVWLRSAACRDEDPDLFFPIGTGGPAFFQAQEAKDVCFSCPLLERCADDALTRREEHGIWGGLDEADRRWLLRRLPKGRPGRVCPSPSAASCCAPSATAAAASRCCALHEHPHTTRRKGGGDAGRHHRHRGR